MDFGLKKSLYYYLIWQLEHNRFADNNNFFQLEGTFKIKKREKHSGRRPAGDIYT